MEGLDYKYFVATCSPEELTCLNNQTVSGNYTIERTVFTGNRGTNSDLKQ